MQAEELPPTLTKTAGPDTYIQNTKTQYVHRDLQTHRFWFFIISSLVVFCTVRTVVVVFEKLSFTISKGLYQEKVGTIYRFSSVNQSINQIKSQKKS